MTSDHINFLQWESEQGIGIDISGVSSPVDAISACPTEKPIAWLRVPGNQLTHALLDILKPRQRIEVIDFGPDAPSVDQLCELMHNIQVERFYISSDLAEPFRHLLLGCADRTTDIVEAIPQAK